MDMSLRVPAVASPRQKVISSFVFAIFFASGFAALLFQLVWQRVLALFSGADVYSVTIIAAAFMAGLGCGSFVGGAVADRRTARQCVSLFGLCELAIALFSYLSLPLFDAVSNSDLGPLTRSPFLLAVVLFVLLLWPTFFMGLSLPLLAKALAGRVERVAGTIGSLYGWNTLGAAVGSFITIWVLIRNFGLESTVHAGSVLNVLAGVGALIAAHYFEFDWNGAAAPGQGEPQPNEEVSSDLPFFPLHVWIFLRGVTGFVALSLEIVWFRLLGVMLKSGAFAFGNLLAIFLSGLAFGSFLGARWCRRSQYPAGVFLALQAAIPAYACGALIVLVAGLNHWTMLQSLRNYFAGYNFVDVSQSLSALHQYWNSTSSAETTEKALFFVRLYFVLPLVLIGPPTFMMGLSFSYLQQFIQRSPASIGHRVGWFHGANVFGSMLGALLTGCVFLRFWGTSATLKIILCVGIAFGFLFLYTQYRPNVWFKAIAAASIAGFLILLMATPSSQVLWAGLHGTEPGSLIMEEDGSGVCVIKGSSDPREKAVVFLNGLGQSTFPYPGVHLVLGMIPVMLHPNPKDVAIIGLGSGATLYGAGARTETRDLICIEISKPVLAALRRYYSSNQNHDSALETLMEDRRIQYTFADGRHTVLVGDSKYDVIEADAWPNCAFSGSLYSLEYFRILSGHLKPGGLAVTWAPTQRVINTFLKVFPNAVLMDKGEFAILVGSNEPISWDIPAIVARLTSPLSIEYYGRAGVNVRKLVPLFAAENTRFYSPSFDRSNLMDLNTDLFPKDEFVIP